MSERKLEMILKAICYCVMIMSLSYCMAHIH